MSRVATIDVDTPFTERLRRGLRYPLRCGAPAWTATRRYAAGCIRHMRAEPDTLAPRLRRPAGAT